MGYWGMGIASSDEYAEVYARFMDAYDNKREVSEITAEILAEYHKEFDDADGVMHDVYFALAKAEWMCSAQSEWVLRRVKEIIDSGANIEFLRELGAKESDLKIRKKNLDAFWISLQTPRAKPRQRRSDPLHQIKELPPLEAGECYAYKYDKGYRIFVVMDLYQLIWTQKIALCCILKPTYSTQELKTVDVLRQGIAHIGGYVGADFLSPTSLRKIGKIELPADLKNRMFGKDRLIFGSKRDFRQDYSEVDARPLSEWLEFRHSQRADDAEYQYYEEPGEE